MFEGFDERYIEANGVNLFVRVGGNPAAVPIVLIHGYPQTSAMWHEFVPMLAQDYCVICPDLRGYGRSDKPESDVSHAAYSKRAMADDIVGILSALGFESFFVLAHDRGARVAHRLGLDYPEKVRAMAVLDIAPTREMYREAETQFATAYWHWYFLIQKYPIPETLIGHDPDAYWKLKCFNQAGGCNPFAPEALSEYLDAFRNPRAIHASCEDYRAAASIDIEHDDADMGKKLSMPLFVLWARHGAVERCFEPLKLWMERAQNVVGQCIDTTHYMTEEKPKEVAHYLLPFFKKHVCEYKEVI